MGYSPWGHKELDTTEQLTLSLIRWPLERSPSLTIPPPPPALPAALVAGIQNKANIPFH